MTNRQSSIRNPQSSILVALLLVVTGVSCTRASRRCSHVVEAPLVRLASPVDAVQLLRRVETQYAQLRSYADRGCVFTTFRNPGVLPDHNVRRPFETTYARPATFRYEYSSVMFTMRERLVVWTESGVVRSWWSVRPGVEPHASIPDALLGFAGVSGGSSHTIPRLLLPDMRFGIPMTRVDRPRVLGIQQFLDGTTCYVIAAHYGGRPIRLWIDRATLAIRRLHERYVLPSGVRCDETTIYRPTLNPAVDPRRIAFTPPRQIGIGVLRFQLPRANERHPACECAGR